MWWNWLVFLRVRKSTCLFILELLLGTYFLLWFLWSRSYLLCSVVMSTLISWHNFQGAKNRTPSALKVVSSTFFKTDKIALWDNSLKVPEIYMMGLNFSLKKAQHKLHWNPEKSEFSWLQELVMKLLEKSNLNDTKSVLKFVLEPSSKDRKSRLLLPHSVFDNSIEFLNNTNASDVTWSDSKM